MTSRLRTLNPMFYEWTRPSVPEFIGLALFIMIVGAGLLVLVYSI